MRKFVRKLRKSFTYGEKGFTLIELLIVLAILGAMAGAIIPNLSRFTESGTKSACLNEAQVIQTAIDAAMADAGLSSITAIVTADPFEEGDTTIATGVDAGEFIRRTITGTYLVATNGTVTVDTYTGLDTDAIDEVNAKL